MGSLESLEVVEMLEMVEDFGNAEDVAKFEFFFCVEGFGDCRLFEKFGRFVNA